MFFLPILLEDTNSVSGLFFNFAVDLTGGDWILLGICCMICLGFLVAFGRVRSGGVLAITAGFILLLSFLNPVFMFVFWIIFIAAVIVLLNAIRKKFQGQ